LADLGAEAMVALAHRRQESGSINFRVGFGPDQAVLDRPPAHPGELRRLAHVINASDRVVQALLGRGDLSFARGWVLLDVRELSNSFVNVEVLFREDRLL